MDILNQNETAGQACAASIASIVATLKSNGLTPQTDTDGFKPVTFGAFDMMMKGENAAGAHADTPQPTTTNKPDF